MTSFSQPDPLKRQLVEDGYCILREAALSERVRALRVRFENDFFQRFTDDQERNRNLLKRFGDSLDVARLFSSREVEDALQSIGIQDPVFCGPVVTHYTSKDITGQSYSLPFHQDWSSMASSDNSAVVWTSLTESGPDTHGLEVVPGLHARGLLQSAQTSQGEIVLKQEELEQGRVLKVLPGEIVLMSPFLPHRTHLNPKFDGWKLAISRRFDDLSCPQWSSRRFVNAYGNSVDRDLYKKWL